MARLACAAIIVVFVAGLGGCETAPRSQEQAAFMERADATVRWFEDSVSGLSEQIEGSAGFVIFPDVAQWGILISGGRFARGAVCRPDGEQIGWAALNNLSLGVQAGVRGFRMLIVIQDEGTLDRFTRNQLSGSAAGVVVAGTAGGSGTARFQNGVAVYEGASTGLMAGVAVGLDKMRFVPLEREEAPGDLR